MTNKSTRYPCNILTSIAFILAIFSTSFLSAKVQALNMAVIGDSMSAEYYGDYDPEGLLASITESFGMSLTPSATNCSGGNFSSGILSALLDAILPLVPMVTDLPARNWVQQLAVQRASDFNFGTLTDNPDLYGEPRLRGYEYNFARVSGTVLAPGLGNHPISQQVADLQPYLANGTIDVVLMMVGSNDFAARELKQESFCDASWFDFQDAFINTMFQHVDTMVGSDSEAKIMIALLPLGTAAGLAEGIVLQRINETNARIAAESQARGIPAIDVWRFNQNPALVNPTNGSLYIDNYTIPFNSIANVNDAVSANTPGNGNLGSCTTNGKCGTLATTLNYISTDGLHPGTVPQGFIANEIIDALNTFYDYDIALLTDEEILEAGGTFIPSPGELTDADKWVQIRQKGSNRCIEIKSNNLDMTVARCKSSKTKQQWYVIPYNGGYQIRSAYNISGHTNGTCIIDNGWRYQVANCAHSITQRYDIYGGSENRDWFIKAASRDSCIYRYWLYEGGTTYGSLGNCGLSWGWNYMRWGFYLNGTSAYTLGDIVQ